MISSPHLLSDIGFESFVHHMTAPYAKPMQSEPERKFMNSSFESSGLSRSFIQDNKSTFTLRFQTVKITN